MLAEITVSTKVADGGRVVIPAPYREALGIRTGDEVVLRLVDGELRLYSRKEAVRRAQAWAQSLNPSGESMVDALLKERRAEAAHE